MKNTIFYIALSLTAVCGCRKDSPIPPPVSCEPIIKGSAYFPASRGTVWNYTDANSNPVQYKIENEYSPYKTTCLPVFSNYGKYVEGENLLQPFYAGMGATGVYPSPIYSLTPGLELVCPISFATGNEQMSNFFSIPWRRKTVATGSTITLANSLSFTDVIVVEEYHIYDSTYHYFDYFANGVGLIKRDSADVTDSTHLVQILMLENYTLGN